MAETKQKTFIKRIIVSLTIYFSLMLAYPIMEMPFTNLITKINTNVADKLNTKDGFNNKYIVFEYQEGDLVAYIKNTLSKGGVAAETAFIRNNVRTHMYMPFAFMFALAFLFSVKRRILFISLCFLLTFFFIEFKLWIYIYDQSNHFLYITDNGQYITKLNDGVINWVANLINKVVNIKGAIYFRYMFILVSCTFVYYLMNRKNKTSFIKNIIA